MNETTTQTIEPTQCVVVIENQRVALPSTTLSDDELRKLITPFWPSAANAEIKRESKDGVLAITLVKRPGTKGTPERESRSGTVPRADSARGDEVLAALCASDDGVNPAVAMYYRLMQASAAEQLDLARILQWRDEIERAIERGQLEAQGVTHALRALQLAAATPSAIVPPGF
ncbi:MAG: hypothetical protein LC737_08775 [Chloroflexi bacterium]|nr:hypothetical protein [Chloroflexota bacterium]